MTSHFQDSGYRYNDSSLNEDNNDEDDDDDERDDDDSSEVGVSGWFLKFSITKDGNATEVNRKFSIVGNALLKVFIFF